MHWSSTHQLLKQPEKIIPFHTIRISDHKQIEKLLFIYHLYYFVTMLLCYYVTAVYVHCKWQLVVKIKHLSGLSLLCDSVTLRTSERWTERRRDGADRWWPLQGPQLYSHGSSAPVPSLHSARFQRQRVWAISAPGKHISPLYLGDKAAPRCWSDPVH